jgi:hypothetical protein
VGRTSRPFTTVALPSIVRVGSGSWPDLRRHALGERELCASPDGCLLVEKAPLVVRQPVAQGTGRSVIEVEDGLGWPTPEVRAERERHGFLTARDHLKQHVEFRLVDQLMVQLHERATQF